MNTSRESMRDTFGARATGIEDLTNELVALVEEFQAEIRKGDVPTTLGKRLVQLKRSAASLLCS